ncbi:unnamed protein product [Phytomonas sp. EM1]|nr:unnamed protein product [Phytomonas sp. EM1]|eukprot:CCW63706.1 unnamed protein product [Phytomonas sp. isolate EM1]
MRLLKHVVVYHRIFLLGNSLRSRVLLSLNRFSSNSLSFRDWVCGCGYSNFSYRKWCNNCGKANATPIQSQNVEQSKRFFEPADVREGDWLCECGAHNFARRQICVFCLKPHLPKPLKSSSDSLPASKGTMISLTDNFLPGDWVCKKCRAHNFRMRSQCFVCASPRLSDSVEQIATWVCTSCHASNSNNHDACTVCGNQHSPGAKFPTQDMDFSKSFQHKDWTCPRCAYVNFESRVYCKICKMETPVFEKSPPFTSE